MPPTSSCIGCLFSHLTCVQKEFGKLNLIGETWSVSTDQILLPTDYLPNSAACDIKAAVVLCSANGSSAAGNNTMRILHQ